MGSRKRRRQVHHAHAKPWAWHSARPRRPYGSTLAFGGEDGVVVFAVHVFEPGRHFIVEVGERSRFELGGAGGVFGDQTRVAETFTFPHQSHQEARVFISYSHR
jgi:hypothetical protein